MPLTDVAVRSAKPREKMFKLSDSSYEGHFVTKCALRLAPLVFVRPDELRKAEWTEFDLDKGEWHIPAARMKMRVKHIVPLSEQAVATSRRAYSGTWRGRIRRY